MRKNVIILTSGLTGSSVLTGLICRGGYWPGETTCKKKDYDTYENERLIALNRQLFDDAGYKGNYLLEYSQAAIDRIAALADASDAGQYREFVRSCERHRPWIWKDPRLWLTIRFWAKFLDIEQCQFILLTRSPLQAWVSAVLRKLILSYSYSRQYERKIETSIRDFLESKKAQFIAVRYEDLIVNPAATIARLNEHLGTALTVADLGAVYNKPLYKKPRSSTRDYVKAGLIYLKNYNQRIRLVSGQQ